MKTRATVRAGFTLVELLLSLIIASVVASALLRMTLAQARFMDTQEAGRDARSVARGGINRLVSDLRDVEPGAGITAVVAGGQDFTIKVPYAFGIMCLTDGATTTLSLLPVDAAIYAEGYSGYAYRTAAGSYFYVASGTAPIGGLPASCTGVGINGLTGFFPAINGSPAGRLVIITGAVPVGTPPGTIFLLYRTVRYEFKNSVALPGRTGLFRTAGGVEEELATPFANTARVNFYVLDNAVAQAAVPAPLSNIRGFELVLAGRSEHTPGGSAGPKTADVTTSVFFENRPD